MGRFLSCGFEWNSLREFGANAVGSIVTSPVRSGTYAIAPASATPWRFAYANAATGTHYWARVYFQIDVLPISNCRIFSFKTDTSTDTGASIRITTTGKLQVGKVVAGVFTQVGSDSAATISLNTWYRIEIHHMINAAAGADDTVEGRLDGVTIAASTTETIGTAAPTAIELGTGSGSGGAVATYDDLAINNGASNDWPGDTKIVLLRPVSDNARVGWTAGGGATTSLFDAVDNLPPVGSATPSNTNQIARTVANTTDTYDANLTTYTNAGIGSADTINSIVLVYCVGHAGAVAHTFGLQMLSNPAITEKTKGTPVNAAGTYPATWFWNTDVNVAASGVAVVEAPSVTKGTSPVMRVRHATSDATNAAYVCAMGAYVDYTPAAPKGFPFRRKQDPARFSQLRR